MKTLLTATAMVFVGVVAAYAQAKPPTPSVPEIDAAAGVAALAAVGAGVALLRERFKR
ncbi:VPEID-CTERM sorting domain-containing protein [Meridianimarinicoccus aquatilis]|uniref:VPEID-CTERM sorting domain-containing protein n=1 Tax=Meridianimarinicoccus aquatilis TaxID=2552766 RepID=A0A4R6AL47_9RHOB|nr:VPEID-CTERM sorting domain-containing protein [Fluviibacterium aquatile]QIE43591.1 VPEID-CTERM sorting domain-containing protein [Rhodobacteraceae bacterium SC52]TDL84710.1 VPEID-CTERM sorting domain-containing protein [Fluviibacterium aquatile]